jgi:hypothetical protein
LTPNRNRTFLFSAFGSQQEQNISIFCIWLPTGAEHFYFLHLAPNRSRTLLFSKCPDQLCGTCSPLMGTGGTVAATWGWPFTSI